MQNLLRSATRNKFSAKLMASQKVRPTALWWVREILNIPYVCLRFRDATMPRSLASSLTCISNFLLSHLKRYDGLFSSPSMFGGEFVRMPNRAIGENDFFLKMPLKIFFPVGVDVHFARGSFMIKFNIYPESIDFKGKNRISDRPALREGK